MMDATLGIDVGTTTAKAAVVDASGRVMARASYAYPTHHLGPGLVEQDPEDWWTAAATAARAAAAAATRRGGRVRAVGVSGQGCALAPVDAEGRALRRAIIWLDTRAATESAWMEERAGAAVLSANGNRIAPYNVEPKVLWLRAHEPATYAAARMFLTTTAFVTHRLCGAPVMNRSDGGILFSYDLARGDWSDAVLQLIALPREKLPPLAACDAVVGELRRPAAAALGVDAGLPVVAGGEDTSAAALAAGVMRPGQAYLSLGTAGTVGVCLHDPRPQPRLLTFPHVVDGLVLLNGSMSSLGAGLSWLRDRFGDAGGDDGYAALTAEAGAAPPGGGGLVFLPYLSGELHPILDPFARGTFIGLSLSTTRGDLVRAVMEGAAYAIRHNLETAAEAGACPRELRAVGRPTRSAIWCQIIADVTGLPVLVVQEASGGAPAGAALLAAAGIGLIDGFSSTTDVRAAVDAAYHPHPERRPLYDALYGVYVRSYARLKDQFRILAEASRTATTGGDEAYAS